jgi:hypothetical protein
MIVNIDSGLTVSACASSSSGCAAPHWRPAARSSASDCTNRDGPGTPAPGGGVNPTGGSPVSWIKCATVNSLSRRPTSLSRWMASSTITILAPASRTMNSHCSAVFEA